MNAHSPAFADTAAHALADKVIAVIVKELGEQHLLRAYLAPTPDDYLEADLGMDALDRICATVALDEAFGIELPDQAMERWERVSDVVASVAALIGEQH